MYLDSNLKQNSTRNIFKCDKQTTSAVPRMEKNALRQGKIYHINQLVEIESNVSV